MSDLFAKHPELVAALIALIWAIVGWIKARTAATAAQKTALTLGDAIEERGSQSLKSLVAEKSKQLEASGDTNTARLIEQVAATVDSSRASPNADLQRKYEELPSKT